jgi:F0F1-type ATP synthase assembly protein I
MLKNWKFLLDCLLIIIVGVILCTVLDLLFKTSTPLLGKIGLGIFAIMIIITRKGGSNGTSGKTNITRNTSY